MALGVDFISTPDGIKAVRRGSTFPPQEAYTLAKYQISPSLLYVYQWKIPIDVAKPPVERAHALASPAAQFMSAEALHCTSHVSSDSDADYEHRFFADVNDDLMTDSLYTTQERRALSVNS